MSDKEGQANELRKLEFNNFIVTHRKTVAEAVRHTVQNLQKSAHKLKNKMTKTEQEKEKNNKKAENYCKQVQALKGLHDHDILKFSILCNKTHEEIFKDNSSSFEERVLVRVANNTHMKKLVKKFKEKYPNWAEILPNLIKVLGVNHRNKCLRRRSAGKIKKFYERERKVLFLLSKIGGLDIDPKLFLEPPQISSEEDASNENKELETCKSEEEVLEGDTEESSSHEAVNGITLKKNKVTKNKSLNNSKNDVSNVTSIFKSYENELRSEDEDREETIQVGKEVRGKRRKELIDTSYHLLDDKNTTNKNKGKLKREFNLVKGESNETDVPLNYTQDQNSQNTLGKKRKYEVQRLNLNKMDEIVFNCNKNFPSEEEASSSEDESSASEDEEFKKSLANRVDSLKQETQFDDDYDDFQDKDTSRYFRRNLFRGDHADANKESTRGRGNNWRGRGIGKGRSANHGKDYKGGSKRGRGESYSYGRNSGSEENFKGRGRGRKSYQEPENTYGFKKEKEINQSFNLDENKNQSSSSEKFLHPSWEARRKQKEMASNFNFQGKRTVFD